MKAWTLWRVETAAGEETKFPSSPFPFSEIDCSFLVPLVMGRSPYACMYFRSVQDTCTSHTRPFVPVTFSYLSGV
jgi:hypothetical protein